VLHRLITCAVAVQFKI